MDAKIPLENSSFAECKKILNKLAIEEYKV